MAHSARPLTAGLAPARLVRVRGAVQGVGFRPAVHRLATELGLRGSVRNESDGVTIHVEGPDDQLDAFCLRLSASPPRSAVVERFEVAVAEPLRATTFDILDSEASEAQSLPIGPDLAPCPACREEIRDPTARRYRYPFTNCTDCGPRLSIVEQLPYDRERTTMKSFAMCGSCGSEFEDTEDRRHHAQPIACPTCGPVLQFFEPEGTNARRRGDAALDCAVQRIADGACVAVLGVGGFHLVVDATNEHAVARLRELKRRGGKPFAVLFSDCDAIDRVAECSQTERELLESPAAPIVLLRRSDRGHSAIAPSVAPDNPWLGCFLPPTPLHLLLADDLERPLIATSGNRRDEPICTTLEQAKECLGDLVDGGFLVHDRAIARPIDDSVVRVVGGRTQILRRARGYAPLQLRSSLLEGADTPTTLALGAHLKNALALRRGDQVLFSPHIGDLETPQARAHQERTIQDLIEISGTVPTQIACDAHPDYASTITAERLAEERSLPLVRVGHHRAHILAVAAEHEVTGTFLGVAWDGTGQGEAGGDSDGNMAFGGEWFDGQANDLRRVARLRPFRLPGGDRAAREPWRAALGLCHSMFGDSIPTVFANRIEDAASRHGGHSAKQLTSLAHLHPLTSSAGRLFDAIAFLLGLREVNAFEADAAMQLEAKALEALDRGVQPAAEAMPEVDGPDGLREFDPTQLLTRLARGLENDEAIDTLALGAHAAMVATILDSAQRRGRDTLLVSGGCFQNQVLMRLLIAQSRDRGIHLLFPERVPPNDGGLALGQLTFAALSPSSEGV